MTTLVRLPLVFLRLLYQSMWLALGQIWANKVRAMLTTIGIVIGVASVTAVIAVLTGLKQNVLSEFEAFGTNKIYVFARPPSDEDEESIPWHEIRFTPDLVDGMLRHCPSVGELTRVTSYRDTVRSPDRTLENVEVLGIDPTWHRIENRPVELGRPFTVVDVSQARPVCLIDAKLRDELGLIRDCIGQDIRIGVRSFRIVGVIEEHLESAMFRGGRDTMQVCIPFMTAWKGRETGMMVIGTSRLTELAEEAQAEISFFLRRAKNLKPGEPDTFGVEAMEKYLKEFNKMATAITIVAGGIVGISLLVGGVGIMNIMLVSVSERTREIGLRKAVGARPSAILLQFLVEAIMLCLCGGLGGVVVAQLLTSAIAEIPHSQMDKAFIPLWAIVVSFGFAAAVGVFFGMFPALKAARLDPIEALRHE